jgi:predicted tellurium resistance membrane protein TerC
VPATADVTTRRLVAVILGVLGVAVLVDVLVIALVNEHPDLSGARTILFVIIGALLVIAGALSFVWPTSGGIETTRDTDN